MDAIILSDNKLHIRNYIIQEHSTFTISTFNSEHHQLPMQRYRSRWLTCGRYVM